MLTKKGTVKRIQKKQSTKKYYFVKYYNFDLPIRRTMGKRFNTICIARAFALDKNRKKALISFTNQNRTRLTV